MHLTDLHTKDQALSAKVLFEGNTGKVLSIALKQDGLLDKHTTKDPAILLCISGAVRYTDEHDFQVDLLPGEYQKIQAEILHWVQGLKDSQVILMR